MSDLIRAIASWTVFEKAEMWKQIPEGAEQFINENYHVYGTDHEKRHILVKMVSDKYQIPDLLTSCWITYFTT